MKTEQRIFTALLLVISLLMSSLSFRLSHGARTLPFLSGLCSALFFSMLLILQLSGRLSQWYVKFERKALLSPVSLTRREKKREISTVGWFMGCTLIIYLLGFEIGTGSFLFLFLRIREREGWPISIIMAVCVTAVIYLVFISLLHVPLYKGVFWE